MGPKKSKTVNTCLFSLKVKYALTVRNNYAYGRYDVHISVWRRACTENVAAVCRNCSSGRSMNHSCRFRKHHGARNTGRKRTWSHWTRTHVNSADSYSVVNAGVHVMISLKFYLLTPNCVCWTLRDSAASIAAILAWDVTYTSRAYATMSVSVCLSVCLWRKCIGAL